MNEPPGRTTRAPETPEQRTPRPACTPLSDPSPATLARQIARDIAQTRRRAGAALPAPRRAGDNNPAAFVREASDLARNSPRHAVSPDSSEFAFVHQHQGRSSIWLARIDGTGAQLVFDAARDDVTLVDGNRGKISSAALFDLQFGDHGRSIYFRTDAWQTSLALYKVELKRKLARFVVDANGYDIIDDCPHRAALVGHIVAYRHSYDIFIGSALDLYFLLDESGRQQGIFGSRPESVVRSLRHVCYGESLTPPALPEIPKRLTERPACGAGRVLRYDPIQFLDGTVLPRFHVVSAHEAKLPFEKLSVDFDRNPPLPLEAVWNGTSIVCED